VGGGDDSPTVTVLPGEILVPLRVPRERLAPVTRIRSTLLLSSLQSLRARALFERYLAALEPDMHAPLLDLVAGVWVPVQVALAHYRACDALRLSADEQTAMGHDVSNRVQGTVLAVTARAARGMGVTPWAALVQSPRLWDRVFGGGGGVEVRKAGPKDARVELMGLVLLDLAYFRHAYRGAFLAGLGLFCRRVYVEVEEDRPAMSAVFRVSWA
jgi:hypothetical protein